MILRAKLVVARNIAPRTYWHWAVIMEGGHTYKVESFKSMPKCLASAATVGLLYWGKAIINY